MFDSLRSLIAPRPTESIAAALERLALGLRPLLVERENLLTGTGLPPTEKQRRLAESNRRLAQAGLAEFNRLIEKLCRSYCSRHGPPKRFAVEDFVVEVLALTYSQLPSYERERAAFATWFTACILPRVYSDLQRQADPSWGRPQPKTERGLAERSQMRGLAERLSLDQTTGERNLGELVADPTPGEAALLEEQCREQFLIAVGELSEAQQWLLQRVYVLQEPQKEIAASLGLTPAAISLRLKQIYRRLAELLGERFAAECGETAFCEVLRREEER